MSKDYFLEHLESKYMYVSVYLSKKNLFQRPSKILSGGGGWGRGGGGGGVRAE